MRDHGIAYGYTESAVDRLDLATLSPQIRSFVDKNPTLLHEEARKSWLLDAFGSQAVKLPLGHRDRYTSTLSDIRDAVLTKSSVERAYYPEADWQQAYIDDSDSSEYEYGCSEVVDAESVSDSFTGWLLDICEGSIYPTFELGSLAFFRSPGHQALMDHLDDLSDIYSPVEDVPAHSLSASMFLPKQSVWNLRKKLTRHAILQPTPAPVITAQEYVKAAHQDMMATAMAKQFALWNHMAQDLSRQSISPGLKSGNTVIDERNFALL